MKQMKAKREMGSQVFRRERSGNKMILLAWFLTSYKSRTMQNNMESLRQQRSRLHA